MMDAQQSHPKVYIGNKSSIHLAAVIGLWWVDFSWWALLILCLSYIEGMISVTLGLHRYFSHRAFKTSRWFQFVLAVSCCAVLQRGPIWWASVHRHHHRFSDKPEDFHSPRHGLFHAHAGWLYNPKLFVLDYKNVQDLTCYPELVFLGKYYYLAGIAYACAMALLGFTLGRLFPETGATAGQFLVYGFFVRTVVLWHGTYFINSLMHVIGKRVYATDDDSKNSLCLALLTMGEGWHNNHHHYPASSQMGFHWWQIDVSYYMICLFEKLGLVHSVRRVPHEKIKDNLI